MESLKILFDRGYELIIVTNQSGVARGIVTLENLQLIHDKMQSDAKAFGFQYADFFYAPQAVDSNHYDRKPNPGMLIKSAEKHAIDLNQSWMIGDRISDVEAGKKAGTKTILISNEPINLEAIKPDFVSSSLKETLGFIL